MIDSWFAFALGLAGGGTVGYIGPGPGLSMSWALIGLLITVFSAIGAVLLWPIRILIRVMREKRAASHDHAASDTANTSQADAVAAKTHGESQQAADSAAEAGSASDSRQTGANTS